MVRGLLVLYQYYGAGAARAGRGGELEARCRCASGTLGLLPPGRSGPGRGRGWPGAHGGYSVEGGRSEGRLARAGGPETRWPTVAEPEEACQGLAQDSFGYKVCFLPSHVLAAHLKV